MERQRKREIRRLGEIARETNTWKEKDIDSEGDR
jgi:hypothetical protein